MNFVFLCGEKEFNHEVHKGNHKEHKGEIFVGDEIKILRVP